MRSHEALSSTRSSPSAGGGPDQLAQSCTLLTSALVQAEPLIEHHELLRGRPLIAIVLATVGADLSELGLSVMLSSGGDLLLARLVPAGVPTLRLLAERGGGLLRGGVGLAHDGLPSLGCF